MNVELDFTFARPTRVDRAELNISLPYLVFCLERLLPWYADRFVSGRGFGHNKALYGHWVETSHHRMLFNRSIFSMIDIYNNLPQFVVDSRTLHEFQRTLTERAKQRCRDGCAWWADTFDCRVIRIQQQ